MLPILSSTSALLERQLSLQQVSSLSGQSCWRLRKDLESVQWWSNEKGVLVRYLQLWQTQTLSISGGSSSYVEISFVLSTVFISFAETLTDASAMHLHSTDSILWCIFSVKKSLVKIYWKVRAFFFLIEGVNLVRIFGRDDGLRAHTKLPSGKIVTTHPTSPHFSAFHWPKTNRPIPKNNYTIGNTRTINKFGQRKIYKFLQGGC